MPSVTLENVCLWGGRILGTMFFLFVSFFVIAHAFSEEGLPRLWNETSRVRLDTMALFLMTVGGVVGWKYTGVASAMIFCGYALWQLVERRLPWPPGVVEIPFVVGSLYAAAWWCRNGWSRQQSAAIQ